MFFIALIKGTSELFSTYRLCFAALGIPALITIALVVFSKIKYPDPEAFEPEEKEKSEFRFNKTFALYMAGISLFAFGFADFTLITLHAAKTRAFPMAALSLLYAGAMASDAVSALFFGWLFDKIGLKSLIISTLLSSVFALFVFLTGNPFLIGSGIILWGVGMGAQESVMKAAVSKIIPKSMRSTGFGIFETGFGIAWFLGSWLLGALYDVNPAYLAAVSLAAQLLSAAFYMLCIRKKPGREKGRIKGI